MRPKQQPQSSKQSIKLPQIANKTMGSISSSSAVEKDVNKQRRPNSSKTNAISELEKKLFSQLETYEQKPSVAKRRASKVKKQLSSSCREITTTSSELEMEKISEMMPQLYTKILQTKQSSEHAINSHNLGPLRETSAINTSPLLITEVTQAKDQQRAQKGTLKEALKTSTEDHNDKKNSSIASSRISNSSAITKKGPMVKGTIRSKELIPSASGKGLSNSIAKEKSSHKRSESTAKIKDSFSVAQEQVERIFQQYCDEEGIGTIEIGGTSIKQLEGMNSDLEKCGGDIQQLERNYSDLIEQLGDICVYDLLE